MKNCRKCSSEFEPSERQLRKHDFLCKPCAIEDGLRQRQSKRERGLSVSGTRMPRSYHAEYENTYYKKPDVRKKRAIAAKKRRDNPEELNKIVARKKANTAIKSGKITRLPCEICGETKVDAHHEDYSLPLDVKWLCRKHHIEHHKMKEMNNGK